MNFERFEFPELEVCPSQLKGVLQCILHSILFNRALGSFAPVDSLCAEMDNVPYAKLQDQHVDACVDAFLDRFAAGMNKAAAAAGSSGSGGSGSGSVTRGNVCLGFHEKKPPAKGFLAGVFGGLGRGSGGSTGSSDGEKVFWERWVVPLRLVSESERFVTAASASGGHAGHLGSEGRRQRLVDCLLFLVQSINEKREHIPPLKSGVTPASAAGGAGSSPNAANAANAVNAPLAFAFELSFTVGDKADDSWGIGQLKRLLKQGPPMLLT